ncbi:putative proline-rich receptor-like protein kinase PERK6 [Amaranthus tricolor]|uniref:putative proline-rich receptor-like protein kinase PERK6 n=1 Tax=Amaranthus tricolor TaxID=29722 RepID=UPI0025849AD5|nr:putative proline-rich receptor-like protein kinase PERK6 [Amaranthus tricolor]
MGSSDNDNSAKSPSPSKSDNNNNNSSSNNNNNNNNNDNNNNNNNNGSNNNNNNDNNSDDNNISGSANNKDSNNNNNSGNNNNNNGGNNNNSNNNNNNNNSKNKSSNSPPPPPPSKGSHSSSSPPPPRLSGKSSSSPPPSLSSNNNNNAALIAGLVVGVGVLLLLSICIVVICTKKKKKRGNDNIPYYHVNHSQQDQQRHFNSGQQYSEQHAPWQGQHQETNYPSSQWSPAMAPPPPPMMSNDMSSANYSSGPKGPVLPPPHPSVALGFSKSTFSYEELATATNKFSQDRLLGQGGFGYVHKGVLPNGKEIAVKSLKSGSGQGEREFQAEVDIISRVHHRHLVSLVGYCIAGGQRMLVYEFVPNNTLEYHLHGKGRPVMDFPTRMRIALGSAKGLAYLHEDCHPRIIHRDIKTANILIDNAFEAKVADFGLAKLSSDTYTHVSTRVMGTFGYLAPEYAASGKLTEKSDVFSFGVMLLELVTGKRPIDPSADEEDSLVDWARPLIGQAMDGGILNGLVDPRLEADFDSEEMMRLIACAGASIRHSAKRRAKMSQIVRALEGDVSLEDLKEGPKARSGSTLSNSESSEYDSNSYNIDMKNFRRTAFNSTDYPSSEYGHNSASSEEMSTKRTSPNPRNFL